MQLLYPSSTSDHHGTSIFDRLDLNHLWTIFLPINMDHLLSFEIPQPFHLMKIDTGAGTGDLYPFAKYGENEYY